MKTPLDSPVFQAISQLGGGKAAADKISAAADPGLDVTKQNVRYWLNKDTIPPAYLRIIYKLTQIPVEKFLEHEEERVKTRKAQFQASSRF